MSKIRNILELVRILLSSLPLKISFAVILLYLFFTSSVKAEISTWSQEPSLPFPLASTVSNIIENKLHIVSGASDQVYTKNLISSIDQQGNLSPWSISSIQSPPIFWHSSAQKDLYLYLLGGATIPPAVSSRNVYLGFIDTEGNIKSWTSINPLPKRLSIGSSTIIGNRIYYAGGFTDSALGSGVNNLIYFADINPTTGIIGTWRIAGNLPLPLSGLNIISHNNSIIVIGGQTNSGVFTVNTYISSLSEDGTINGWNTSSPLPQPSYRSGVVKMGDKIYVAGGNIPHSINNVYYTNINGDGTMGSWRESNHPLPQPLCCMGAVGKDSSIFLIGGYSSFTGYLNTVISAKTVQEEVNENLNVPFFSQNASPWGESEYDHASDLKFNDTTMDRWGCAVTSAAMVLNFHDMTHMPNNSLIDPGTLNDWLKLNNGYITGTGKDGPYSFINWGKISQLTRDLFDLGKSNVKLEHKKVTSGSQDELNLALKDDLTSGNSFGKFPAILKVSNDDTSSHFIVAKGVSDDTFSINDPEWDYPTLASFENKFSQINRFVPSQTNFSSIRILVNPDVEVLITDPSGKKTGRQVENDILQSFDEIPHASYGFEESISNPDEDGNSESFGSGVNEFWFDLPPKGIYKITLSSSAGTFSTINAFIMQANGDNQLFSSVNSTSQNNPEIFYVSYDPDSQASFVKSVTFASTFRDISEIVDLELIEHGTSIAISAFLKSSEKFYGDGNREMANEQLMKSLEFINKFKGSKVNVVAFEILNEDFSSLEQSILSLPE